MVVVEQTFRVVVAPISVVGLLSLELESFANLQRERMGCVELGCCFMNAVDLHPNFPCRFDSI